MSVFEQFPPVLGQEWALPPASALPALPAGRGYGCFTLPNSTVGIPLRDTNVFTCDPGFFCPYVTPSVPDSAMVGCPPSVSCETQRLSGGPYCLPQGRYEPVPCPGGFYCPDQYTIHPCPAGSYCLTGSTAPTSCQFLSSCPAGSIKETHYGLLVIVIIIDILLACTLLLRRVYEAKRANLSLSTLQPMVVQRALAARRRSGAEDIVNPAQVNIQHVDDLKESIARLADGFKRGNPNDLRMNFRFNDLQLTLPNRKAILQGATGDILSGRMTAIMGPSGAGKTTFMSVLMGKVTRTGGDLLINGQAGEMHEFRKIIGFVPQEDIMHRELTVREVISHAARIRLPSSWTNEQIEAHVDNVLNALKLSHVAHSPIGDEVIRGVSGGQRKRVNIGMELAAIPLAIFLDEPTSGLDSTASSDVMEIFKAVCKLGVTVVAVIHQPRIEVFNMFDDVLLLVPGGKTAYFGPTDQVQDYFASLGFAFDAEVNPADVLMDILAGRGTHQNAESLPLSPADLVSKWDEAQGNRPASQQQQPGNSSTSSVKDLAALARSRGASFLVQVQQCHARSLVQQSRAMRALVLEVFVGVLAGVLFGGHGSGTPHESYQGILAAPYTFLSITPDTWVLPLDGMMIGISLALSAAPPGVRVFGEEKPIYWRETASGQSTLAYYVGKTVAVAYRIALSAAHYAAVYYLFVKPPYTIGMQFLMLFLNIFTIYGVAAVITMLVARRNTALLAVVVTLFMAVFCGFGPTVSDATTGGYIFVFDMGPNVWATEAMYSLSWQPYQIYDIAFIQKSFGYTLNRVTSDLWYMTGLAVGYRVLAYFLMIGFNRDKQK